MHSILVTNHTGHLLFARYFDPSAVSNRAEWEHKLFEQTHRNWAHQNVQQIAVVWYAPLLCYETER
jgi:hypothetical protein